MFQLRNVLTLAASLCLMGGLSACDSDDDDDDGGEEEQEGETAKNVLVILDSSKDVNASGTAGADICFAKVECDEDNALKETKVNVVNDGKVCTGDTLQDAELCSSGKDRGNADALKNEGCNDLDGKSGYVSLGMGGSILLTYEKTLVGCDVTVGENNKKADGSINPEDESYNLYICEAGVTSDFSASDKCVSASKNPYNGDASEGF